jgi:hypothetical protein
MNKDRDSVIELMTNVYQNGNTMMCLQAGMTAEDTTEKVTQSRPAVQYLMSAIFDKLDENNILVEE